MSDKPSCSLKRTNSENPDFIKLVAELDAELAIIDGDEHAFYSQYNKIDKIKEAIVVYKNDIAIACGAIKPYSSEAMEVKRMYVNPEVRNMGTATFMLKGLEKWATELGYKKCILETGKRQEDALALYAKNRYKLIPNYGQYVGIENSVCYKKDLD
jgi:GNAT superfamily N-acetyltransferase